MIKCIATDMDGTLLNGYQKITEENKAAILKAQEQGVEVVVATGRSYQEAIFVLEEAGLKCPVIGVNGAEVRTPEGEIVVTNPLTKQQAKEAAAILRDLGIYFEVYTNKGTYTDNEDKGISAIIDIFASANPELSMDLLVEGAKERFVKGLVSVVENYEMIFEDDEFQVYKFLAFSLSEEEQARGKELLQNQDGLAISSSGHLNIEITSQQAQKGVALEAFVKERGIEMSETMAIGDNENDLSMLRRVGRAVAMENASYAIKAECDVVTATNDESGVGKAILEVL
ncbi:HAD family hydrolase [Mesobacillus maritimus]|uniref:Cof-type HAD-IIB family hydrolase n=1 Tax=Mesobacillus maritimus TaxID=1643336 RepID=UPI00203C995D|nr:Cof-type HAD-IIB family hydrolase [Mesobacillus maritimus]MCM3586796.1 HAD family hydrolase [Mesobacillus maritimus]MCM3668848.1 HAD family hydrolase [Mesobacillus maritimus]